MKIILPSFIATAMLFGSAQGATVSLNNIGSGGGISTFNNALAIVYAGTQTAASGGIASAGFFNTLSDAQVATLAAAPTAIAIATLVADFQVVFQTTLDSYDNANGLSGTGLFNGDASGIVLPNATRAGDGLYTFLGDQSSLATSTQVLLWDNTATIAAEDSPTSPDTNDLLMANEGAALIAGANTTTDIDLTAISGPASFTVPAVQLVLVPEPSTVLLSALGVLGLLRRKR